MKKRNSRRFIALIMALAIVFCSSIYALAAPSEVAEDTAAGVSQSLSDNAETDSFLQGSENASPNSDAASENSSLPESADNNAPFFAGAGIAILAFVGVIIFCKVKGNK